jgi:hypothetical protein
MLGFTVVNAIFAYFLLFGGFFIIRNRIPPYLIWFHYLNEFDIKPPTYFVRGIMIFDNTPLSNVSGCLKVELLKSISKTLGIDIIGAASSLPLVRVSSFFLVSLGKIT